MIPTLTKTIAVSVCSTILATLAVNAIDIRGQASLSLLATLLPGGEEKTESVCPEHMVLVTQALVPFCVDVYEASPARDCLYKDPGTIDETTINLSSDGCRAASLPGAKPWVHISQTQAVQACSRAGKRLLSANEWYKAALGTPDLSQQWTTEQCNVARNVEDGRALTGSAMRCVSDSGAYDMIGNVWEWVDETATNGVWQGRSLPQTGYVQGADTSGVAYETATAISSSFASDRFWSDPSITAGFMRGGYFDGRGSAGIFSTYAASPPTFTGEGVGFRCAVTATVNY